MKSVHDDAGSLKAPTKNGKFILVKNFFMLVMKLIQLGFQPYDRHNYYHHRQKSDLS